MRRRIKFCIMILLCVFLLTGCPPNPYNRYAGPNQGLNAIAINTLLGGFSAEYFKTIIMEEDDYGRVMFAFAGRTDLNTVIWSEDTGSETCCLTLALIVAQKTTDDKAYFYDGKNCIFIECSPESDILSIKDASDVYHFISDETEAQNTESNVNGFEKIDYSEILELKEANDWNKKVTLDKCFSVDIRADKDYPSEKEQDELLKAVGAPYEADVAYVTPLTTDSAGKTLYFIGRGFNALNETVTRLPVEPCYLVMTDNEGRIIENTGIIELPKEDYSDYQNTLLDFKTVNGWNFC